MEKGHLQKTLDHGYVKLVDYMGNDDFPLENARMSTDKPTGLDIVGDHRLRDRLWGEQHTSPFEMNVMCFEVQLPLFVLQQIDRHRTVSIENHYLMHTTRSVPKSTAPMDGLRELEVTEEREDYDSFRKFHSENEFSGRYSTLPDLYYLPLPQRFGGSNPLNKQGTGKALSAADQEACAARLQLVTEQARAAYKDLLELGAASEIARYAMVYTQYTKIRIQAGLKNWLDFLNLRLRADVQVETRIYARQIARCIEALWPRTWQVFLDNTLHAVKLTALERSQLTALLTSERNVLGKEPLSVMGARQAVYEEFQPHLGRDVFRFLDKILPKESDPDYLRCELVIPESW